MKELFRSPYMVAALDGGRLELTWLKMEPNDDHAIATAHEVTKVLEAYVVEHPEPLSVLVDVRATSRPFPRATAVYARWVFDHKLQVKAAAVVASSFLVRTAILAAVILPGLKVKGFSDLDEARAHLDSA